MKFRDYYEIMGVARDAPADEIKRAYRKLARKYHPDVSASADAEEKFKEVGEAYEVLKDPDKRAAYDQLGANYKSGQEFRPPPDWSNQSYEFRAGPSSGQADGGFGGDQFSDFFESLFRQRARADAAGGFGARRSFDARGDDRRARVAITIRDSYTGTQRQIALQVPEPGARGGRSPDKKLNVKIPKGVRPGQSIRLAGQGGAGTGGGGAGDLFLEIEFAPDVRYRVDGVDVTLNLPVAPWEAALGSTVTVPLPDGKNVELTIPAGSRSGNKLRLKGKGLPADPPGHLVVELEIRLPPADSDEAKALYRKMADELPFDPRADL